MLQSFLHNWNLKLMSLVLAVALWSHVRGEVNPWETATFRVPLTYRLPDKMVLLNRDKIPAHVKVTLRAPRLRLRELKGFTPPNPLATAVDAEAPLLTDDQIQSRLDFSLARLGKQNIPVKVDVAYDDVEVIGKPDDVVVMLDRASEKSVAIAPELTVARGYEVQNVQLRRDQATVYGPSNVLENVAGVRVKVRSGALQLNAAKTANFPLEAVDEDGDTMPDVRVLPETIPVTATLREAIVTARVSVEVSLPASLSDADVQVTPRRLMVRGSERILSRIKSLPVEPRIPAQNTVGTFERRVRVPLPAGVRAVDGNTVRIRVSVAESATPTAQSTLTPTSTPVAERTPVELPLPDATPAATSSGSETLMPPPARRENLE
jgi:YbbR domain-containing protein